MFIIPPEDLHDQAGMERAFSYYFSIVSKEYPGTFNDMLGARLESCDYETSTVTLSINTQGWMANPGNMIHGGVTASALDMVMGLLCRYCGTGYMTPTIDMSVSYLRPAPLDKRLFVRAHVTMRGFTICHAVGTAWPEGDEDRPVATAVASYYVTRRPDREKGRS